MGAAAPLDALWNLDKHRRLTLMDWWPDLLFCSGNGPAKRAIRIWPFCADRLTCLRRISG